MKIKEITVHYNRKQGLPGFSSMEYGAGMTIELDPNETVKEAFKFAWVEVQDEVLLKIKERMESK